MVDYQWGVFWANLDPARGSEQAGVRPVLVVSVEEVNKVLPVLTVLSLTSLKEGRKIYPVEVFLPASETGLPRDSIAMAYQIRSIAKSRLGEKCGAIVSASLREQIRSAVKLYLDL
ncbi:mRNA interferase MazF9 [Peptococcaceae bacterium CEB3]|nr:mRNA interferase MazF9 [Peptococcaceae bacterium CEB3]